MLISKFGGVVISSVLAPLLRAQEDAWEAAQYCRKANIIGFLGSDMHVRLREDLEYQLRYYAFFCYTNW